MINKNTPKENKNSVESESGATRKIWSDSVKPTVVYKLPKVINPHPKISFLTWLLLLALVVAGVVLYKPFFSTLPERFSNYIVVNNVKLPKIVNGLAVAYGRVELNKQKAFTTSTQPTQPTEGVVEGVSYGDPFNVVDGLGQGWLVFSKPSEGSDINYAMDYFKNVVTSWTDLDVVYSSTQSGNRFLYLADGRFVSEIQNGLGTPDLHLSGVGVLSSDRIFVLLSVSEPSAKDVNQKRLVSVLGAFLGSIEQNQTSLVEN